MTREEWIKSMQAEASKPAPAPPPPKSGMETANEYSRALSNAFVDTATFGLAPRAVGATEEVAKTRESHPGTSITGDVLGLLGPMGIASAGLKALTKGGPAALRFLSKETVPGVTAREGIVGGATSVGQDIGHGRPIDPTKAGLSAAAGSIFPAALTVASRMLPSGAVRAAGGELTGAEKAAAQEFATKVPKVPLTVPQAIRGVVPQKAGEIENLYRSGTMSPKGAAASMRKEAEQMLGAKATQEELTGVLGTANPTQVMNMAEKLAKKVPPTGASKSKTYTELRNPKSEQQGKALFEPKTEVERKIRQQVAKELPVEQPPGILGNYLEAAASTDPKYLGRVLRTPQAKQLAEQVAGEPGKKAGELATAVRAINTKPAITSPDPLAHGGTVMAVLKRMGLDQRRGRIVELMNDPDFIQKLGLLPPSVRAGIRLGTAIGTEAARSKIQ